MLDVYADFAENHMAMPVIKGEKTAGERFPGAVSTLAIEAMMQDRKALQAGTSHFLGQNFSRAQEIKFQDQNGQEVHAWTTSWGVSTRLVGALIMTHADDDGLILPPRLAPKHVVILPIYRNDEERSSVLAYCNSLAAELRGQSFDGQSMGVLIDDRDLRGGEKSWQHIKRGVPIRLEIGPRDVAANSAFMGRRDRGVKEKAGIGRDELVATVSDILREMQLGLFQRALRLREQFTRDIDSLDEFKAFFTPNNKQKPEIHGGFARCHYNEEAAVHDLLTELKVTIRCVPLDEQAEAGKCFVTGKPSTLRAIFAKAY
jgi:prolyl-tRNA synthetase